MEISPNLTCAMEEGDHGVCIRLKRGSRWIVFSPRSWTVILKNVARIEQPGAHFILTKSKEINNVTFKDKRYISFHHIRKVDKKVYDTYINMNEAEWEKFKQLPCVGCKDTPVQRPLFDGCLLKTMLTPKELQDVRENNETAYNQLAYQCEYCGNNYDYGVCHCHQHNCSKCEPDNFCKLCNKLLVQNV